MKEKVRSVLRYFEPFDYKPNFEEIYTYLPIKIGRNKLKDYIDRTQKHTLGEYSNKFKVSLKKIKRAQNYLDFISKISQIRLIGLSGSVAMLNAKDSDDIDLFIVASKNRLWTARFISVITAWIFGLKRNRSAKFAKDKVCLNLFFSEDKLKIDAKLHNEYMAHEVLQMMPILVVNQTYRKFLYKNDWILKYFPNVRLKQYYPYGSSYVTKKLIKRKLSGNKIIGNLVEIVLKKFQLIYMSRSKENERVEKYQLWFHPRDYSRIVNGKV